MTIDVTDFQKEVVERSKEVPVLVDFWADWCGPCKMLGPVLERLAEQANGAWVLAKVDTEAHPQRSTEFNIRSIPNVKLFVDGKVEAEFAGALPEPMVKQWLQKNIPSKWREEVRRAEKMLLEKRTGEAEIVLENVVQHEPQNHKALVLLARTIVSIDQTRATKLVQHIEADSEFYDVAEAIRVFADLAKNASVPNSFPDGASKATYLNSIKSMITGEYASALEGFISIIRNDRNYDDDGARKACIAIFKLLGEEHETTQTYRREFSRALY
jgi:putative thioredoxin